MDLPPGLSIPQADWEQTPFSVQVVFITLWQENQSLKQQVAMMQKQVNKLEAEVAKLREQVNKNSHNSSKPPSSDGPQTPPGPKAEPSGRKAGGQKGLHGHGRKLKPPEQVNILLFLLLFILGRI
jgi:hypothetical protein